MPNRIFIVGAGGFGRETYCWIQDVIKTGRPWEIVGFLDDNQDALRNLNFPLKVIGSIATFQPKDGDLVVCAIGNPQIKKSVVETLKSMKAQFATIIHPTASVCFDTKIGPGCIICPNAVISTNVQIGEHVCINVASAVGHDATIDDYVTLSSFCDITGGVTVGKSVFFGSHAAVLPGLRICDNAIIGAGSVVTRNITAACTVFGVPAKQITF